MFQQVFDEEYVARDSLNGLDEQVIQGELSLVDPCTLLFGRRERGWEGGEGGGGVGEGGKGG